MRLEISQCHQTWYIQYVRYGFLLMCYSNFIPQTRRFSDIRLQKCWDLDILVRGQSRSLKVVHLIDYVLLSYSKFVRTVLERFNFKNAMTLKTRLGVSEGHWKCHCSIEHNFVHEMHPFLTPPPLSIWPHLCRGAGLEKRRGEQLKWSLAFRLYIGSFPCTQLPGPVL